MTIDIAFDWDSNSKSGYDGFCLCGPSGFDMAVAGNPPPNVRGISTADQLQFKIYDISDQGQASARTLGSLAIEMRSAHDHNSAPYPFDPSVMGPENSDGWYPIANLSVPETPSQGGESGVFGGPFPNWAVSPSPLQLVNAGWYFFKVVLTVSQDGTAKTFGNDPELIVGPRGG